MKHNIGSIEANFVIFLSSFWLFVFFFIRRRRFCFGLSFFEVCSIHQRHQIIPNFEVKPTFRHLPFPLSVIIQSKIFVIKLKRLVPFAWNDMERVAFALRYLLTAFACLPSLLPLLVFFPRLHFLCTAAGTFQFAFVCIIIWYVLRAYSKIRHEANLYAFHEQNFWFDILYSPFLLDVYEFALSLEWNRDRDLYRQCNTQVIPLTASSFVDVCHFIRMFTTFEATHNNEKKISKKTTSGDGWSGE